MKPASGLGGVAILGYTIKDPVRAALLTEAVQTFVTSGDLREELLPLMWEPVGLHEDDYGAVLLMLCASGVLFLAEHTQQVSRSSSPPSSSSSLSPPHHLLCAICSNSGA